MMCGKTYVPDYYFESGHRRMSDGKVAIIRVVLMVIKVIVLVLCII